MKKRSAAKRSALGLIASGVSTIMIGQTMPRYRFYSSKDALARDRKRIGRDAQKAFGTVVDREFA